MTDENLISNRVTTALLNTNLTFTDVKVSLDRNQILINNPLEGRSDQHFYFNETYLRKAREATRSALPVGYRLKPQKLLKFDDLGRLIIDFETTESKRIDVDEVEINGYEVPLMKGVNWDISKEPHALICGITGSGKSMMLKYLFKCFQQMNAELYVIDPKYSDLYALANKYLSNKHISVTKDDTLELLRGLCELMDRRQRIITKFTDYEVTDAFKAHMSPIVLFYDELAALASNFVKKAEKDEYNALLKNLVLKGRSAGIVVIFSMQKPLASNIPTEIRDQCSFRLVLGKSTPLETRRLVFGENQKNIVIENENMQSDEWNMTSVSNYGGWYALPTMSEPFQIFESPNLQNLLV
ncbi:cell division protein FtsK [Staphylococcus massiliensis]|uniref:FtsK/SpoIIIE domain-containing protein n=1 Tax=Staphylococcus massiliensis TaxID=555791 RepID=UPI001EDF53F0|nr:FtsK/SpoIIIE domain-containing protein [Staphylococcus massiliensis]MCG3402946.1 cell division protein FtsK [Staphylococcus massiliensis]